MRAAWLVLGIGFIANHAAAQTGADARAPETSAPAPAPLPAPIPAQSEDDAQRSAIARALFGEGLGFVDAAQWQDAADRFERVLEIRYSPVAAYNLGLAQARLGKIVLSVETLRKLKVEPALDVDVRDSVAELLAETEPKLAWLTLSVTGACDGCEIVVDDQPWPAAAVDVAVPVDPGPHVAKLVHKSKVISQGSVEPQPGERALITLRAAPVALSPEAAALASSAQARRSPSGTTPGPAAATQSETSVWSSPWLWGAVGAVGLAAIATVVVIAASPGEKAASAVPGDFNPGAIEVRP